MSNSEDLDEMARCEPSHLDLRCLQNSIIIDHGSERVNSTSQLKALPGVTTNP